MIRIVERKHETNILAPEVQFNNMDHNFIVLLKVIIFISQYTYKRVLRKKYIHQNVLLVQSFVCVPLVAMFRFTCKK